MRLMRFENPLIIVSLKIVCCSNKHFVTIYFDKSWDLFGKLFHKEKVLCSSIIRKGKTRAPAVLTGILGNLSKTFYRILSVKGVPPPPTPLTDNHFPKKTIADRGGYTCLFFCLALNMGRPVEKGCPLWHRKEIQSLYIPGPVGYLQFSSAPQANSLRGKF